MDDKFCEFQKLELGFWSFFHESYEGFVDSFLDVWVAFGEESFVFFRVKRELWGRGGEEMGLEI